MTKQLLLFIQSDNAGLYVNIITHCVQFEGVHSIYFAVNSGDIGNLSEAREKIKKIKDKFEQLSSKHPHIYRIASDIIPPLNQLDERIIKILFTNPEFSTKELNRKFHNTDKLLVDISGCNKKVSSDVISSYILKGISHICCCELDDKVYSQEWRIQGLGKDFHDIRKDIPFYEYIDFSRSGTTIESFNQMRSQGNLVKLFFSISIILGVMVFVLIQQQQNALAQYGVIFMTLATGLGLFNDIFGMRDRFK